MNKTNLQHAINVMKRAGRVNMGVWQSSGVRPAIDNEKAAHRCNTAACFAGWVAVSPEFQQDGGEVTWTGAPKIAGRCGSPAIAFWLGLPQGTANDLCAVACDPGDEEGAQRLDLYYGKPVKYITAADVIEKLEGLLNE